ncbi:MAG: hypothetical protein MHMPM18_004748, partial [Marteilia pararefringens]
HNNNNSSSNHLNSLNSGLNQSTLNEFVSRPEAVSVGSTTQGVDLAQNKDDDDDEEGGDSRDC